MRKTKKERKKKKKKIDIHIFDALIYELKKLLMVLTTPGPWVPVAIFRHDDVAYFYWLRCYSGKNLYTMIKGGR